MSIMPGLSRRLVILVVLAGLATGVAVGLAAFPRVGAAILAWRDELAVAWAQTILARGGVLTTLETGLGALVTLFLLAFAALGARPRRPDPADEALRQINHRVSRVEALQR